MSSLFDTNKSNFLLSPPTAAELLTSEVPSSFPKENPLLPNKGPGLLAPTNGPGLGMLASPPPPLAGLGMVAPCHRGHVRPD